MTRRNAIASACFFLFVTLAAANPYGPNAFAVLSEVQLKDTSRWDSTGWAIEVYPYQNAISSYTIPIKDSTIYGYRLDLKYATNRKIPPLRINHGGYGIITQRDYPNLTLHPGDSVVLYADSIPYAQGVTWKCVLPSTLRKNQSMASKTYHYYAGPAPAARRHTQTILWHVDSVPTMGSVNNAFSPVFGSIRGVVRDSCGNPAPNFGVNFSLWGGGQTDSGGKFLIDSMLPDMQGTLEVRDPAALSSTYYFGQYKITEDSTIFVACTLKRCIGAVGTQLQQTQTQVPSGITVLAITHVNPSGISIHFSSAVDAPWFKVAILDISGRTVYSTSIVSRGAGTYATAWDGAAAGKGKRLAPGNYVARVYAGQAVSQKQFFIP
jgi:hypothetical protein